MASKSKSGKDGKTKSSSGTKGEVITVRLGPKLKYGLDLLTRKQHRTLSSVVTWAIEQAINDPENGLYKNMSKGLKVAEPMQMLDVLWDIEAADRLVKIAIHWPELMTYEEELVARAAKDGGWGWPTKGDSASQQMRDFLGDIAVDAFGP